MKKILLILFVFKSFASFTQNIARVVEYVPAPGQHINLEQIGIPQAAQKMAENENSLVSLGSFGGYIVLKFDEECANDPGNPYGVDFTIFGNAFSGSSEPGVVWVMNDENQNGQPDDTWYQIAGSHYFHSKTIKNYRVKYFRGETRDVHWKDNHGNAGTIKANSFQTQNYYPEAAFFTEYPKDSVTFSGTKLDIHLITDNPFQISVSPLHFGYADNFPKKNGIPLIAPDNPYTKDSEGAGGDPIDISWAVDSIGNYVDLDEIQFVKIVTGGLLDLGQLGEISTDVSYVVDTEIDSNISGMDNCLVVYYPPSKMIMGDTVLWEANYFEKGRRKESQISCIASDDEIIEVVGQQLIARNTGISELQFTTEQETKTFSVQVVVPDSIAIDGLESVIFSGDSIVLNPMVYDNSGNFLDLKTTCSIADPEIGQLVSIEDQIYFVAKKAGFTAIICDTENYDLQQSFPIEVKNHSDKISVLFTLKTEQENLFPLQKIEVKNTNLNDFVENRQKDYSTNDELTLAHALISGMQNTTVGFKFSDDDNAGGKLYLYSLEKEGMFTYGWGGKTNPEAFSRAWIVRLNGEQYLNGFDSVQVTNGDTVFLYHVSNITKPWEFSRLIANKDSAAAGEMVELSAEQTTCFLQNDSIIETGFQPLTNIEISSTESYFTNDLGIIEVFLNTTPPWIFYAENDAVRIKPKIITRSETTIPGNIKFFPNPADKFLNITTAHLSGFYIRMYNSTGKQVFNTTTKEENVQLNIEALKKGMYFVQIEFGQRLQTFKFIKN